MIRVIIRSASLTFFHLVVLFIHSRALIRSCRCRQNNICTLKHVLNSNEHIYFFHPVFDCYIFVMGLNVSCKFFPRRWIQYTESCQRCGWSPPSSLLQYHVFKD
jgi:hypothetical protein